MTAVVALFLPFVVHCTAGGTGNGISVKISGRSNMDVRSTTGMAHGGRGISPFRCHFSEIQRFDVVDQ